MDELKEIAPKLSKMKKEPPFGVPDNYFDDFSARLQMKLEAEKKILPHQQNRIIQFLKPALGLAASFALIFMLVNWPLKSFTPGEVANNTTTVPAENDITDLEYRTIIEGMDDNSFYALLEEPSQTVEISDDDLLNYLSANVSDYDIYLGTEN